MAYCWGDRIYGATTGGEPETGSPDAVWCWGNNHRGQLGDGTSIQRPSPVQVDLPGAWVDVVAGGEQTCALDGSGAAMCWGANSSGQLGDGSAWSARLRAMR